MEMTDILDRLRKAGNMKVGDTFAKLDWPINDWGPAMSALFQGAAAEIVMLRSELEAASRRDHYTSPPLYWEGAEQEVKAAARGYWHNEAASRGAPNPNSVDNARPPADRNGGMTQPGDTVPADTGGDSGAITDAMVDAGLRVLEWVEPLGSLSSWLSRRTAVLAIYSAMRQART